MKFITVASLTLFLAACSSSPKIQEPPPTPPAPAPLAAAEQASAEKQAGATLAKVTETATQAAATNANAGATAVEASAPKTEVKKETPKGVAPKQALKWLQNGNTRFVKGYFRKDGVAKKDIARLISGQHPHTIVLSCSDSRVPPEIIFDQKLGEIFVVRTAGESLDSNVVASIEYGVEVLGARLVLVMGHTYCGAIKEALITPPGGDAGSPALSQMVAGLQPRLKSFMAKGKISDDVARESMANAQGIVDDLRKQSAILRTASERGELEIRSALYHLNSGAVSFE